MLTVAYIALIIAGLVAIFAFGRIMMSYFQKEE